MENYEIDQFAFSDKKDTHNAAVFTHCGILLKFCLPEKDFVPIFCQFVLTYSCRNGKLSEYRYTIIDMGAGRHLCLKCGAIKYITFRG